MEGSKGCVSKIDPTPYPPLCGNEFGNRERYQESFVMVQIVAVLANRRVLYTQL
jgi:hypothetical protein